MIALLTTKQLGCDVLEGHFAKRRSLGALGAEGDVDQHALGQRVNHIASGPLDDDVLQFQIMMPEVTGVHSVKCASNLDTAPHDRVFAKRELERRECDTANKLARRVPVQGALRCRCTVRVRGGDVDARDGAQALAIRKERIANIAVRICAQRLQLDHS